jgi:small nuclear ribonucleoprotein (snRNP)-like protein
MNYPRRHHFKRRHPVERQGDIQHARELVHPEHTGSESSYLKSLVDSHAKVTVVLKDGERFHGHIRYYDRYCFSIGPLVEGPKIFVRKDSISYISEE